MKKMLLDALNCTEKNSSEGIKKPVRQLKALI
jgi:hypothetical protein